MEKRVTVLENNKEGIKVGCAKARCSAEIETQPL